MNILIAEDDRTTQAALKRTLEKLGHQPFVADTGAQAWEWLQAMYFPVVITDFQMPDMDGMTLSRRIRACKTEKYSYIVMLSSFSSRDNYLDAVVAGVDDFLAKPLDAALLAARLHVAERIIGLQNHVKKLESLMQVCSYCKKVRNAEQWVDMQEFVAKKYGTQPSHGICPNCFNNKVRPEMEALGIPMEDYPEDL
jgi:DNA-binding response OmpR family regulator